MIGKQMQQAVISIAGAIMDPKFRARKNFERPPFLFWGPAGAGKSHTMKKAGTVLNIPVIGIRLGQELAEDMSYPEVTEEHKQKYLGKIIAEMFPRYKKDSGDNKVPRRKNINGEIVEISGEYQINFTKIKNYIENWNHLEEYYNAIGLSVDDAPGGIIFLDEVNRIEDKQMFQMIFQLFDSGKFKGYVTPEEMSFFAAANPNEGHIVQDWFADDAFKNRVVHLRTKLDFDTWLDFATESDSGYDDLTIQFYKTYPKALFDPKKNDFKIPSFSSSYRNAAFLSLYVNTVQYPDPAIREELLLAIVGEAEVPHFHLVEDQLAEKAPTAEEILNSYDEYDVGSNPLNVIELGKTRSGNPIPGYEIDTLKDALEYQEPKGDLRKRILQAQLDGKTDLINEATQDLVDYFHRNAKDEKFKEMIDANRLRFLRFMLDLPRGKFGTTFQQLVSNHNQKETSPLIADLLTSGDTGLYVTQLIKYIDVKVVANAQ
ncbi:hypothetical protein [Priestia aryabhattai]